MTGTEYTWGYRISRAASTALFNLILWILVPSIIFSQLASSLPSSPVPLNTSFVYAFGITITALQVLSILTIGMAVSAPFRSGSYLAEAYYIWAAVNGGSLAFSVQGVGIGLAFQPLLFLLVLPPLFNAVRAPITYLLEQSDASAPSPDTV